MLPDTQESLPSARIKMQQEGMYPNMDIPVGTHHPQAAASSAQIEDLKRSLESRFASISTPSNMLQAGLYKTLGNNPLTQGISAAGGAVGDIWNSLLSSPEKKNDAKDPLTAMNKQTKLLSDILYSMDDIGDAVKFIAYEDGDHKGKNEDAGRVSPRSGKHVKQDSGQDRGRDEEIRAKEAAHNQNKKMLEDLKKTKGDLSEKLKGAKGEEKEKLQTQLKATDAAVDSMERTVAKGAKHATPIKEDVDLEKNIKGTDAAIKSMENRAKETGLPEHQKMLEDLKKTREQLEQKRNKRDGDKQEEGDPKQEEPKEGAPKKEGDPKGEGEKKEGGKEGKGFFTQLFDRLGLKKASSSIEQFTGTMKKAAGELSKSFADTAKTAKKKSQPLVDAIKGSESAKLLKMGKNSVGKYADIAAGVAKEATGSVVSLVTGKAPEEKKEPVKEAEATAPEIQPGGSDAPSVGDIVSEGAEVASEVKGAGSLIKGGAKKAAGFLGKGAKVLGKGAAVLGAGMASYDAVSEEAQGKHIDSLSDIVPDGANKINPFDWVGRAGRYVGNKINKGYEAVSGGSIGTDLYGAFHKDPMAQMDAMDKANRMNKDSMQAQPSQSKASAIEVTKSQIDDAKSSSSGNSPDTVIGSVNNNVNKSTTVLPSRISVNNTDSSFNRYVGRSLA